MKPRFHILSAALLCCALTLPAAAQEQPAAKTAPQPAPAQEQISAKVTVQPAPSPSPEQAELAKLTAENQLTDQRLKKKLQQINAEKEELRAQYELELQKQKSKAAELEAELARTAAENKLAEEKRKLEISKLETEYQKLASQSKLSAEQAKALTAAQGDELSKLTLENKLAEEKNKKLMAELALRIATLKAQNDLSAEQQRSDLLTDTREKNSIDLALKRLDLRAKKAEWKKESNTEPVYTDKPFISGKLVISDRRIALNGPIFTGVGDYMTENINYYNNISTQPIFIVIDNCPGGSVVEGYRILKAIQSSKAPIYTVVKSFAASMAAAITTLADRSYVYPNAIILHHQMSSGIWGNMTQMKEQLEQAREWDRRLNVPIAKKMGVTLEEFRKKMYERNSDGDWREFGDKAVELKWADFLVDTIEETGITKNPEEAPLSKTSGRMRGFELEEKTDEKGQRYISLPRLQPFDFYFIHNPDRYYR